MVRGGDVTHLARGLYQLPDASHGVAEAAKRVPKGVVCPVSALTCHELTDRAAAHGLDVINIAGRILSIAR